MTRIPNENRVHIRVTDEFERMGVFTWGDSSDPGYQERVNTSVANMQRLILEMAKEIDRLYDEIDTLRQGKTRADGDSQKSE